MSFPGKFTEHLMPEHVQRVSLSFLVDTMDKRRGGCAPEHRLHAGAARRTAAADGHGRAGFRRIPAVARGGGRRHVARARGAGKFTASFFCSTDPDNNQIASFYTGAMANAGELSFRDRADCDLAIISPNDPGAMVQYAEECRTLGIPYIFDPGQQCARMSGDELRDGLAGARMVICNDYEFELIRQKTGLGEDDDAGAGRRCWSSRAASTAASVYARDGRDRRAGGDAAAASWIRPASATRSAAAS